MTSPRVAVLVPCYNEEAAIRQVVTDFRAALPEATVYVYDNNSTDQTIAVAKAAGAVVRTEKMRGKGNVVRRMYADIEADVYVLVDGDDTYEAAAARGMVDFDDGARGTQRLFLGKLLHREDGAAGNVVLIEDVHRFELGLGDRPRLHRLEHRAVVEVRVVVVHAGRIGPVGPHDVGASTRAGCDALDDGLAFALGKMDAWGLSTDSLHEDPWDYVHMTTWNFLPFLLKRVGVAPAWAVHITFAVWYASLAAFADRILGQAGGNR